MDLKSMLRFLLVAILCQVVFSNPFSGLDARTLERRNGYQPTLQELEATAVAFIKDLKEVEPQNAGQIQLMVVGGTAIWHLFPKERKTQDLDFMILSPKKPPKSLKESLMQKMSSKYKFKGGEFVYELSEGKEVGIDAVDYTMEHPATAPRGLKPLNSVTSVDTLPWINSVDLLFLKMISCSERTKPEKCTSDARDAQNLVMRLSKPIHFSDAQKKAVSQPGVLETLSKESGHQDVWWEEQIGLKSGNGPGGNAAQSTTKLQLHASKPAADAPEAVMDKMATSGSSKQKPSRPGSSSSKAGGLSLRRQEPFRVQKRLVQMDTLKKVLIKRALFELQMSIE